MRENPLFFKEIKALDLSRSNLTVLPPEIGKFTNLRRLDLSDNQLSTLPASIDGLVNLKALDLNGNRLTTLPASIGGLVNLQRLYLFNNQLTTLPTSIGKLVNLQALYLSDNRLIILPAAIFLIPHCRVYALKNRFSAEYVTQFSEQLAAYRRAYPENRLQVQFSIHDAGLPTGLVPRARTLPGALRSWSRERAMSTKSPI